MSHKYLNEILLFSCTALLATGSVGGSATVAQTPESFEMLPLWQRAPALDAVWLEQPQPRIATIDMGKLNSEVLAESVEESRRIVLLTQEDQFQADPQALPRVMELLRAPNITDRRAKLAFLSAAIALADESKAQELWEIASTDPAMSATMQAALVSWKNPVALDHWRSVLNTATSESESLQLALRGLGAAGEASDAETLQAILTSDWVSDPTRLQIVKALGNITSTGQESLAAQQLSVEPMGTLLAAHILRNHSSAEAQKILTSIVEKPDALGKATAFESIVASNKELAFSLAKPLLKDPNSNVRMQAVMLYSTSDKIEHLREQGYALRDAVPEIRAAVRNNMLRRQEESPEKQQFVIQAVAYYLKGDFPTGAEEAINLAVALRLEQACVQMVPLLDHPRPALNTRAAWGLQEIVRSPKVLEKMLPTLEDFTARLEKTVIGIAPHEVAKNAFLMGAFGRTQYAPAADVLQTYVPKAEQKMQTSTRAAAIWALGRIHARSKDPKLGSTFAQRMMDNSPNSPEEPIVKYASALALGMIQAPNTKDQLESVAPTAPDPLGLAATWALTRYPESP